MKNITERVAWAIGQTGRNDMELGKLFGVSNTTIKAYRNERGDLKGVVLAGLAEKFGFNPNWILTGEGDPYIKEKAACIEVFAPRASTFREREETAEQAIDRFAKAVAGLKEIYDSADPILVPAIEANIMAFQISVRRDKEIKDQRRELDQLRHAVDELQQQVAELTRRDQGGATETEGAEEATKKTGTSSG